MIARIKKRSLILVNTMSDRSETQLWSVGAKGRIIFSRKKATLSAIIKERYVPNNNRNVNLCGRINATPKTIMNRAINTMSQLSCISITHQCNSLNYSSQIQFGGVSGTGEIDRRCATTFFNSSMT